jgi:hypothetical protein
VIYDFKCSVCGAIDVDVVLSINHTDDEHPQCCYGMPMDHYHTVPPQVLWTDPNIEAFRPVATENAPVISSMRQHREYMAKHDLVDANDLFTPPTAEEQKESIAKAQESIDAITPNPQQAEQLGKMGLDSIVD